jgi:hypothetical protein
VVAPVVTVVEVIAEGDVVKAVEMVLLVVVGKVVTDVPLSEVLEVRDVLEVREVLEVVVADVV